MLIRIALFEVARRVGPCLAGGLFLWQVALHVGPRECEVVIHSREPGAVVSVDGVARPADPRPCTPIVVDLGPGSHTLTLDREGKELYREEFVLKPGDHIVLTARDEARFPSNPVPRR